ncbi:MAG: hypothetical protein GX793_02620 [Bacteroidales bacterium]|jgi:hypothetical protein|nr:hypothetical protein [Bacteroidales bacterium]MCK9499289.1 hypothetical protein [Bacteroidales bacterium]MDY0313668.1 hypothetical protein [Bacteroidales bacterium]NLB85935.1 hypothetical protein [Bacteroidales bacterium]
MERKLVIAILGNQGSGKTTTWETLFGRKVHTGKNLRNIEIQGIKIPVFLINESALERKTKLEYILPEKDPEIVISSFLYHKEVIKNFDYFIKRNYNIYVQWLNPGYNDSNDKALFYNDGIINYLLGHGAVVSVKNAKNNPKYRVEEIKNYLLSYFLTKNNLNISLKL